MIYTKYCDSLFHDIYKFFCKNVLDVTFFSFDNIYYTDNMKEDVLLFCKPKKFENTDNYGVTILPNKLSKNMIVLINIASNNVIEFAKILIHELTHVYDFNKFAEEYYNGILDNIMKHDFFECYRHWSEFRAHAFDELYTYKYMDNIEKSNNIITAMQNYEKNISLFLEKKHEKLVSGCFDIKDLPICLGKIYTIDIFNNIHNINQSCIGKYLKILFHTNIINQVFSLYSLYFELTYQNNIFSCLLVLQTLEESICQI